MDPELKEATEMLHRENCSCVIARNGSFRVFRQRGVRDLYGLLSSRPELLHGSSVADKVVGKGAAALMALGKVKAVHADTLSEPALSLLTERGIPVEYTVLVPHIVNRAGTGICPVEDLCAPCVTAEECLPLIAAFINKMNNPQ